MRNTLQSIYARRGLARRHTSCCASRRCAFCSQPRARTPNPKIRTRPLVTRRKNATPGQPMGSASPIQASCTPRANTAAGNGMPIVKRSIQTRQSTSPWIATTGPTLVSAAKIPLSGGTLSIFCGDFRLQTRCKVGNEKGETARTRVLRARKLNVFYRKNRSHCCFLPSASLLKTREGGAGLCQQATSRRAA